MLLDDPIIKSMERWGEFTTSRVVCTCDRCGEQIFEGDDVYIISWCTYCVDCIENSKHTA